MTKTHVVKNNTKQTRRFMEPGGNGVMIPPGQSAPVNMTLYRESEAFRQALEDGRFSIEKVTASKPQGEPESKPTPQAKQNGGGETKAQKTAREKQEKEAQEKAAKEAADAQAAAGAQQNPDQGQGDGATQDGAAGAGKDAE